MDQRAVRPASVWADVAWVKERWGGKFILKGIMDVEDARLAVEAGADAIVVSNHGGRQLDGAPSSISALPAIVAAVGDKLEVWMDGGIRSGQDVLKAWALGARGTLIGRAMAYGLGAMGEAGVTRCLEIIAQGAGRDDGVLRPHAVARGRSQHPAAGHLLDLRTRRPLSPPHRAGPAGSRRVPRSRGAPWQAGCRAAA